MELIIEMLIWILAAVGGIFVAAVLANAASGRLKRWRKNCTGRRNS